jgi:hypothetical protein
MHLKATVGILVPEVLTEQSNTYGTETIYNLHIGMGKHHTYYIKEMNLLNLHSALKEDCLNHTNSP